jgi:ATP-dependent Clp protease ATP-binding subunit ClpC
MTSNLGTQEFQRQALGFQRGETKIDPQRLKSAIDSALKQTFRPEFLNRIDEVIIFEPLTEEQIRQIVDLMLKEVQGRLSARKIELTLAQEAKAWLAKQGFDPIYGARPLRRTIQRLVENPLSKKILQGEVKEGDNIIIGLNTEGLFFTRGEAAP